MPKFNELANGHHKSTVNHLAFLKNGNLKRKDLPVRR